MFIVYFLNEYILNMIYSNNRFESMAKRCRYSECYLNIGITTVLVNDGIEKSQCVLCHAVLSAESIKSSRLKHHLEMKHPKHAMKYEQCLKNQRLDASGSFQQQNAAIMEPSYEITFQIAQQKTRLEKHFLNQAENLVLG